MKGHFSNFPPQLFGTATIGEKGQIVIPVDARKKFNLKTGDKLIVVGGPHGHALILMRPEQIVEMAAGVTAKMNQMLERLSETESHAEEGSEDGPEAPENPEGK